MTLAERIAAARLQQQQQQQQQEQERASSAPPPPPASLPESQPESQPGIMPLRIAPPAAGPNVPPQDAPPAMNTQYAGPGPSAPPAPYNQTYWNLVAEEWHTFGAYRRDAVNYNEARRRRDEARLLKLEKLHQQEKLRRRDARVAARAVADYRASHEHGQQQQPTVAGAEQFTPLGNRNTERDPSGPNARHARSRGRGRDRSHTAERNPQADAGHVTGPPTAHQPPPLPTKFEAWTYGSWSAFERLPIGETAISNELQREEGEGKLHNVLSQLEQVDGHARGQIRTQCEKNAARDPGYVWTVASVRTRKVWTTRFLIFPKVSGRTYSFILKGSPLPRAPLPLPPPPVPQYPQDLLRGMSYPLSIDSLSLSSSSSIDSEAEEPQPSTANPDEGGAGAPSGQEAEASGSARTERGTPAYPATASALAADQGGKSADDIGVMEREDDNTRE